MSRAFPLFVLTSLALIAACSDQPAPTAPTTRPDVALTSSPTPTAYSVSVDPVTLEGFPGSTYNIAAGVSPAGDVVGVSQLNGSIHAARWSAGSTSPVDLGIGTPFDINAAGQLTGEFGNIAALWTPNGAGYTLTRIGDQLPNAATSSAAGINASGQVVGNYTISANGIWVRKCFLWTPVKPNATTGTVTTLPDFGGTFCVANDVNSNGYVVGASTTTTDETHGFVWTPSSMRRPGKIQDLTPNNGPSYASAINDLNQVAGQHTNTVTATAAIWTPANGGGYVMTELGTFTGSQTWATDINDAGFVVGFMNPSGNVSGSDAFLWQNGEFTLLPGVGAYTSASAVTQLNGNLLEVVGGSLDNDTSVRTALRWSVKVAQGPVLP